MRALPYDVRMRSLALLTLSVLALACIGCPEPRGTRRDAGLGGGTDTGVLPGVDAGPPVFRCSPGLPGCFGNTYYTCGDDGMTRTAETVCPEQCDARLGCVTCRPGTRRCNGTLSEVCVSDGSGYVAGRDCADWSVACGGDGFCADACADTERTNSNVGCEYWPVPLANTQELDPSLFDFRVVVANPNDVAANVRVMRGGTMVWSGTIDPRGLRDVVLPWIDGQSFEVATNSWQSFVREGAYRLLSDAPVIVTQFNPFEYENGGTFSFTNDASLLLPAHVLTGRYVVASYMPLSRAFGTSGGFGGDDVDPLKLPGYVAIVATSPGTTTISLSASGNIAADAGGRIRRTMRGGTLNFTLQRGEVAHVMVEPPPDCTSARPGYTPRRDCSSDPFGGTICDIQDTCAERDFDLSGSRITADQPIEVFGGHTCAYVPWNSQACDHLEEQMPPVETLGREYVGAPLGDGSLSGTNVVRVIAGFADTTVTIDPPMGGVSGGTLSTGQYLDFEANGPFRVSATQGVMVAQYIRGQFATMPESMRGDPALTVLVPAEQYRSDYTFILPTSYNAGTNGQNHVLVIRPPGLAITVDGAPVTASFSPIGGREVGVLRLEGGTHRMEAAEPFGIIAYGLGSFTSYATPAGLNLEPINILF
jgi:hypothetical protein